MRNGTPHLGWGHMMDLPNCDANRLGWMETRRNTFFHAQELGYKHNSLF